MNGCLSRWWELICLANLAIFQKQSSKGYSKQNAVRLQVPSGSSHRCAVPACCYWSHICPPRAAANSRTCCPEHHRDVQAGLCQWAHTHNLLFFKCTSHQKPHFRWGGENIPDAPILSQQQNFPESTLFAKLCNSEHSTLNSHLSRHCEHSISIRVLLYTELCSNPACKFKKLKKGIFISWKRTASYSGKIMDSCIGVIK